MQFVPNGPDVPLELIQAHEDGNVVFFCGAGISYPAGLPGFGKLVKMVFKEIGERKTEIEKTAFRGKNYDSVLGLLEQRLNDKIRMRESLEKILKPKFGKKGSSSTHKALIDLGRCRNGDFRLVTTNFDLIFENIKEREGIAINSYVAPLLPVPKKSRWNGLVYLHGRLPKSSDNHTELKNIVLTSGDFGLAYLVERWAARFVSELFKNYTVCFVGYSINDPVLRYMMDALVADRLLGEQTRESFVFAHSDPAKEKRETDKWKAKGVTPILYHSTANNEEHTVLHKTLSAWAETYRGGIDGKCSIVSKYAGAHPTASTKQDDFVGRVLWALADPTGIPARHFAALIPCPPLSWLESFTRGKLLEAENTNAKTTIVSQWPQEGSLNKWQESIVKWFIRHLNDPELFLWFIEQGGNLHREMARSLEWFLIDIETKCNNDIEYINKLKNNSPNAVPDKYMRTLWRFLLLGKMDSRRNLFLEEKFAFNLNNISEITTSHRLILRELLQPIIIIRRALLHEFDYDRSNINDQKGKIKYEVHLYFNRVDLLFKTISKSEALKNDILLIIEDLESLLKDTLLILQDFGDADKKSDGSCWHLTTIEEVPRNMCGNDWAWLMVLLGEVIIETNKNQPLSASVIANSWFQRPFAAFKRLALYAARHGVGSSSNEWVNWVLSQDVWWLWSLETQREVMRLLAERTLGLSSEAMASLENAILKGPPREMFKSELSEAEWNGTRDHMIWHRLRKILSNGGTLSPAAQVRLREIAMAHPNWELPADQSDEFIFNITTDDDDGFDRRFPPKKAPRRRNELVTWLRENPWSDHPVERDNWWAVCKVHPCHCFFALSDLAEAGDWPEKRWNDFLYALQGRRLSNRAWVGASEIILLMPESVLGKCAGAISQWLKKVSPIDNFDQMDRFFALCERVIKLKTDRKKPISDFVGMAINHPVGHVTEALLDLQFSKKPSDNDWLDENVKLLFNRLFLSKKVWLLAGRVILASRVIQLFRIDREWTTKKLLPLFDWSSEVREANAVWEGFLWGPRIYAPLLSKLKKPFLDTAAHYDKLGSCGAQYAKFVVHVALYTDSVFSSEEIMGILERMPMKGLEEASQVLPKFLDSAGDQRVEAWGNRMKRFIQDSWPKSVDKRSAETSESLALMCIAAGDAFGDALKDVGFMLRPIRYTGAVMDKLEKSELYDEFPNMVLELLDKTLDNSSVIGDTLRKCLNKIDKNQLSEEGRRLYTRIDTMARAQRL